MQSSIGDFLSAAVDDHPGRVRRLLREGLDVNAVDSETTQSLLMTARSAPRVFQLLLDLGADVHQRDGYDHDALQLAVASGELHAVRALLQAGASAHSRNRAGVSVLQLALNDENSNHKEILQMLFQHGAADDLDLPNRNGVTPRQLAIRDGVRLPE